MSETLQNFYVALHQWIMASKHGSQGNPHSFSRRYGICFNLALYCEANKIVEVGALRKELADSFVKAKRHPEHPFNATALHYNEEHDKFTNRARLNWIKNHLPKEPQ